MGETIKITGADILNSNIPGQDLLILAVHKLLKEGVDRQEISTRTEIMVWDMYRSMLNGEPYGN